MAITKVTNSLVATNAIQGTLIADNAITSVHIAQNQVTAVQIPDGSITATQLAANSVDSSELVGGSIDTTHIADAQITTAKIGTNQVTSAKIAQNSVGARHIADGSITDTQLGSGAFTMGTITTTGQIRGPASLTIDPATVGDNTGTVVIAGNLQVDGSTTTINSTQLSVVDKKITVGKGSGSSSAANESGFEVGVGSDGASSNPSMLYSHSGTKFVINKSLDVTGTIQADNLTMLDNEFIRLGNSNDLQIFCDGTDGYIRNHVSGGSIYNRAYTNWVVQTNASDGGADDAIKALRNAAVELYYDNDLVFQTITTGAQIGKNNDGTVRLQLYGTTGADHEIFFGNDGTNGHKDGAIRYFGEANGVTANRRSMTFSTANSERLRIDSAGKIKIGNNIPMWSGSYGGGLFLKGNNATSDRYAQLCIVDSNGAIAQAGLKVNNNGSVTVGGCLLYTSPSPRD